MVGKTFGRLFLYGFLGVVVLLILVFQRMVFEKTPLRKTIPNHPPHAKSSKWSCDRVMVFVNTNFIIACTYESKFG